MIALSAAVAYLVLLAGKAALAIRAARRGPQPKTKWEVGSQKLEMDFSGVVIAQAILSGDPRLRETIEDNVRALPSARFVWIVDTDDPTAQAVCQSLIDAHATTRIDLIVAPPPREGCNPKLFKLERARHLVGDGVLLVLDDDTRMPAASLRAILTGLDDADLATGLPGYLDDGGWPSKLLAQFVNNNAALTYLPLLNFWPPVTINGMAYAMRGPTIERLGGFTPLLGYLTDDLAVARHVLAAGGRISQTARPHWVQTTVTDGRHYVQLMHRWFVFARLLLRRQPARMQVVIAVLHALPSLLLWVVVAAAIVTPAPLGWIALAGVFMARASVLIALQHRIYGRSLHRPLHSAASELLQPFHLFHAVISHTIIWRTRRYDVRDDHTFLSVR